jgi:hypothetical protein
MIEDLKKPGHERMLDEGSFFRDARGFISIAAETFLTLLSIYHAVLDLEHAPLLNWRI